jgi:hypothetical protein
VKTWLPVFVLHRKLQKLVLYVWAELAGVSEEDRAAKVSFILEEAMPELLIKN